MSNSPPPANNVHRPCDFCNQSTAIFYCRADTAKLCLSCDRQVHATNPLFSKHTRSLLCDGCDSSPASIFCSTDAVVHCQNCDWEKHGKGNSPVHDRRPIEGFSGCPSVNDLVTILGFEDLGKIGEEGFDGFEDCLVWETPAFVRLDDLIVSSSGYDHGFQAMGVPPLPKNRNAAMGTYKEEILYQLRELAKSDPNDGQEMVKPTSCLEDKFEENVNSSYELQMNTFQWCPDSSDAGGVELYSNQLLGHNTDGHCVVPDEKSINLYNSSRVDATYEGESHHDIAENTQVFHGVATREINSQERETALTRYKEKKKSRRYDKQIRYVSRKVRAESRTRIRGRFAKMDR